MPSVNGGADINQKDFFNWTPLHCAAFLGQTKYIRYLLTRQNILLEVKNDEEKTPLLLAIEAGNVFNEDNAVICLLERGAHLDDDFWHKLLTLSLNYDIVTYSRLAMSKTINIHNPLDEQRISLHKAVCLNAVKIIKFFNDNFSHIQLVRMIEEKDFQGFNALEYARLTERPEILDMVEKMRAGVKVEIPSMKNEEETAIPIN